MPRTTVLVLAHAAALAALLTGCGAGQGPTDAAAVQPSQAAASRPSAPASTREPAADPVKDAAQLAAALHAGKVRVWTAENDPNNLLGRPGQYTSAASVRDPRVECSDPNPGAACGATVEVFASSEDANARAAYVAAALKSIGDTEYHTVAGNALLRVTGDLTPKQAAAYAAKFRAASVA